LDRKEFELFNFSPAFSDSLLVAAGVAVYNWRKTRHEMSGSAHYLLEVGEGRTRFLAMFGVFTSGGFLIAFIFSAAMLFLIPLCE
jgi:hypothetical protein